MNLILTILMTMQAWRIRDWEYRENADTRKYVDLVWFRSKVKLAGEGLGYTLSAPNGRGPHLYGMFKLFEQIAAGGRNQDRGWLFRNGSPMTAQRIAALLRLPEADVEEALNFFSTPPMDWLAMEDMPGESPTLPGIAGRSPGESPTLPGIAGRNAPSDRPNNVLTNESKKINKKAASPEEAKQQSRQFSANQARRTELEAIPDDDRTFGEAAELKKVRATLRTIQKKQAAGDFTPLETP